MAGLRDADWAHLHLSERTITFGRITYNLNTRLSYMMKLPKNYFGKEFAVGSREQRQSFAVDNVSSRSGSMSMSEVDSFEDFMSSEESEEEKCGDENQWTISSV